MNLFDLTGKTAVVTGGTRGIGLMIARGLLQAGASVYLSSRKPEAGEAAVAELSAHGRVVSVPADLAREEECVRLAAEVGRAEGRVHVLARELGPRHITVNAVAPGPFESKMMAATLAEFGDEIAASSPLGRIGRPDDMAGVAIFLSSRAGAYVTGAVIPVDGGIWTAH